MRARIVETALLCGFVAIWGIGQNAILIGPVSAAVERVERHVLALSESVAIFGSADHVDSKAPVNEAGKKLPREGSRQKDRQMQFLADSDVGGACFWTTWEGRWLLCRRE